MAPDAFLLAPPPYQPQFPDDKSAGIGIIGTGSIVRNVHLNAYQKYGLTVTGVYDPVPEATATAVQQYPFIGQVYASVEALLADPQVKIVDIATPPHVRPALIAQALAAGKHILAQKPLANTVAEAENAADLAGTHGLRLAVNQNGRWSPPWRIATLLIEAGAIGEVTAVTHLFDTSFTWLPGDHFDEVPHTVMFDYAIHWFDITRCWLERQTPDHVRAFEFRAPDQPAEGKQPWNIQVEMLYTNGASAVIRGVGNSKSTRHSHPFWIHGTEGTIRGQSGGGDFVELDRTGVTYRYDLQGDWFPDGFAAAMGELMCAIAEDREPSNSARHNLLSLQLARAACESAAKDGAPVKITDPKG